MLKGFLKEQGPKHRFTDYSKAKICIELARSRVQDRKTNRDLNVQPFKTQDFILPNHKSVERDMGSKTFTKKERGELFPVLEEHSFPAH